MIFLLSTPRSEFSRVQQPLLLGKRNKETRGHWGQEGVFEAEGRRKQREGRGGKSTALLSKELPIIKLEGEDK